MNPLQPNNSDPSQVLSLPSQSPARGRYITPLHEDIRPVEPMRTFVAPLTHPEVQQRQELQPQIFVPQTTVGELVIDSILTPKDQRKSRYIKLAFGLASLITLDAIGIGIYYVRSIGLS